MTDKVDRDLIDTARAALMNIDYAIDEFTSLSTQVRKLGTAEDVINIGNTRDLLSMSKRQLNGWLAFAEGKGSAVLNGDWADE